MINFLRTLEIKLKKNSSSLNYDKEHVACFRIKIKKEIFGPRELEIRVCGKNRCNDEPKTTFVFSLHL